MKQKKTFILLLFIFIFGGLNIFPEDITDDVPEVAIDPQHFVFIHGAWHGAWCWFRVQTLLEEKGHTVRLIELPAHGIDNIDPGTIILDDYKNAVVNYLDSINEQVILVGHSMAGIVISSVAEARPLKIKKLIYLAAFLLENGQSLQDIASQDTASIVPPNITVNQAENTIDINLDAVEEIFYEKTSKRWLNLAKALLKTEPLQPFITPLNLTTQNYGSVRRFYIKTTLDKAITPSIQEMMITAEPCEDVYFINSDHSPFFTTPTVLKNKILEIAAVP